MKKTFVSVGILGSLLLASPAIAQSQPFANLQLVSPAPGSTVEGPFELVLRKNAQCQVDIALRSGDGNGGTVGGTSTYAGQGEVRIQVDPGKPLGPTEGPEGDPNLLLGSGMINVAVLSGNCVANTNQQNVLASFTYQPPTAAPSAVPTPTPTPSITPHPVPAELTTGWLENLDPALVVLIGAVAGSGVTGLAEYSWIRYRRRHKASGLVK
ncbi:MAG TPA: hypothetical protein VIF43_03250 [Patescibacteria group bacterium]|jgi:hypothetical protein